MYKIFENIINIILYITNKLLLIIYCILFPLYSILTFIFKGIFNFIFFICSKHNTIDNTMDAKIKYIFVIIKKLILKNKVVVTVIYILSKLNSLMDICILNITILLSNVKCFFLKSFYKLVYTFFSTIQSSWHICVLFYNKYTIRILYDVGNFFFIMIFWVWGIGFIYLWYELKTYDVPIMNRILWPLMLIRLIIQYGVITYLLKIILIVFKIILVFFRTGMPTITIVGIETYFKKIIIEFKQIIASILPELPEKDTSNNYLLRLLYLVIVLVYIYVYCKMGYNEYISYILGTCRMSLVDSVTLMYCIRFLIITLFIYFVNKIGSRIRFVHKIVHKHVLFKYAMIGIIFCTFGFWYYLNTFSIPKLKILYHLKSVGLFEIDLMQAKIAQFLIFKLYDKLYDHYLVSIFILLIYLLYRYYKYRSKHITIQHIGTDFKIVEKNIPKDLSKECLKKRMGICLAVIMTLLYSSILILFYIGYYFHIFNIHVGIGKFFL